MSLLWKGRNHLFFTCSVARLLWNILKCAFNLSDVPENINALVGNWVKRFSKIERNLVMVGISTICWTLWKFRNGVVFDNNRVDDPCTPVNLFLKWLRDWNILQRNPERSKLMEAGVRQVGRVAEEVFMAARGWRPGGRRITAG